MQMLAVFLLAASLAGAQAGDAGPCPNIICKILARGRLAEMQWPDFADFRTRLEAFYGPAYAPAWLADNKPTAKALAMIELLKQAELKGLKPEDYDAGLWDQRVAHLDRFQFDVELTVSLLRY